MIPAHGRLLALAIALAYVTAADASGLDQLHAFLTETKTSNGTFKQSVASKTRPTSQNSSGTFAFQRPGKFRWTYDKPFEQIIVGDGARVWVYDRDLNQVVVRKLDAALGATPAALLAGDNALEKNFTLVAGAATDGLEFVEATPKNQESQFTRVRIGFRDNGRAQSHARRDAVSLRRSLRCRRRRRCRREVTKDELALCRQQRAHARMIQHFPIDDELRSPAALRIDNARESRDRHIVKAFVGPAQRMRRDDHVIHGE